MDLGALPHGRASAPHHDRIGSNTQLPYRARFFGVDCPALHALQSA